MSSSGRIALVAVAMVGALVMLFGGRAASDTTSGISFLIGAPMFIGGLFFALRGLRSSKRRSPDELQ